MDNGNRSQLADPRLLGIRALVDSPHTKERIGKTHCLFDTDCGNWDWVSGLAPASYTVPDLEIWRALCSENIPPAPPMPRRPRSEG